MTLALRLVRLASVSGSRFIYPLNFQLVRRYCSKTNPSNGKPSRNTVRENVNGYMFTRFFNYVKNYDKVLEKNFPSAVRVYRMFFDGMKDFFKDIEKFVKISRIAKDSTKGPMTLNRRELELYMTLPKDMVKVAPTILLSSLPMVGYAVFPLAYMYPRTFLTKHFWTLQQRSEFQQHMLSERLAHNRPVFRCLQALLEGVKNCDDHKEIETILGLLGSGFHPSEDQLLNVKDLFSRPPYSFSSLSSKHIKLLLQMHGLPGTLFKGRKIREHAFLVHYMDLAIIREGGVHNMPQEALRYACFLRGLNPSNLSNQEMIDWVGKWIKVSTTVKKEHLSLFLHLPIFFGYNHPNNWQLIYGK